MLDTVIIGAGPAGLTACLYAKLYGLDVVTIGDVIGGKLILAPGIIDYPGIREINGKDFVVALTKQLEMNEAKVVVGEVIRVSASQLDNEKLFETEVSTGLYTSRTIIFASGNSRKQRTAKSGPLLSWLGVECEDGLVKLTHHETNISGVFAAGDCALYPESLEQLTTAVSTGAIAAAQAYRFLKKLHPPILWGTAHIGRM